MPTLRHMQAEIRGSHPSSFRLRSIETEVAVENPKVTETRETLLGNILHQHLQ